MTRSRKLAEIAAAYQSGNPLSFRNKIINGNAIIGQRGTVNVTTTAPAYGTDRMLSGVVAGTGINANLFKSSFGGSSSGLAHYISGSFTNGTPYWCQRIEAQNCQDLNSQWITVSGLLYQDTGSTLNFTPRLSKAPSVDVFTGATAIATNANVSVPSGVVTPFATRFQLGSTDASNGVMFEMFLAGVATVTSKNFCITDLQLEKGVIQTMFENRFVGAELTLAQRYYYRAKVGGQYSLYGVGYNYGTTTAGISVPFPVQMRTNPTGVEVPTVSSGFLIQSNGSNLTPTAITIGNSSANAANLQVLVTVSNGLPSGLLDASAASYIGFTGAEL